MLAEVTKRLFTAEEYHRMGEAGILGESEHLELIDGEIIQTSPMGHSHIHRVLRANAFLTESFGRRALVSIQLPLRLNDWTEPEPDVVVYKPRADFYSGKRPTPADVLLVVEIADTSLAYDEKVKLPRFAAAGIPEFWIENLKKEALQVYRDPVGERYQTTLTLRAGDSISPLAFPDVTFRVDDLLG